MWSILIAVYGGIALFTKIHLDMARKRETDIQIVDGIETEDSFWRRTICNDPDIISNVNSEIHNKGNKYKSVKLAIESVTGMEADDIFIEWGLYASYGMLPPYAHFDLQSPLFPSYVTTYKQDRLFKTCDASVSDFTRERADFLKWLDITLRDHKFPYEMLTGLRKDGSIWCVESVQIIQNATMNTVAFWKPVQHSYVFRGYNGI